MRRSLLGMLGRCHRLVQNELRSELGGFGIGLGEFRVVGLLLDEPDGLSQAELCQRLGVTPPTLSVAVRALEQRGVVQRRPDESDGRIKRVVLEDDVDLEPVFGMLARLESELVGGIGKKDIQTTIRVLTRVSAALEQRSGSAT